MRMHVLIMKNFMLPGRNNSSNNINKCNSNRVVGLLMQPQQHSSSCPITKAQRVASAESLLTNSARNRGVQL